MKIKNFLHSIFINIKIYWLDINSNVFNDFVDAIFGLIVLIILPAVSLYSVHLFDVVDFWNYTFPILSIGMAGIYDSYGRYEKFSPKNKKLIFRIVLDSFSVVFSAYFVLVQEIDKIWYFLSPSILLGAGIILLYEVYLQIKQTLQVCKWYPF